MADQKSTRSVQEIESDLETTRARLASNVDELTYRASPAELKRRQVAQLQSKADEVKAKVATKTDDTLYDENGELRLDLVAKGLGGVAAVSTTLGLLRRAFYRG